MHLQLHRQLELALAGKARVLDILGQRAQHPGVLFGFEARRLEIGRQADLQHVLRLSLRPEGLGVRAGEAHQAGLESVPDARVGVAVAKVGVQVN